jgi:hypothetical protein
VKDSGHLELDWLLSCELEELIASVRPMSAKNCEQYVRAILGRVGGPSFEQLLMRIVETMVPITCRSLKSFRVRFETRGRAVDERFWLPSGKP